jgi:hypothetical protein
MGQTITNGGLNAQFNFEATRDRRGFWTGWQEFHCERDVLATVIPNTGASWELIPFMKVVECKIVGHEGRISTLRVNYEGASPGEGFGGGPEPEYVLAIAVSDEPIGSHPRYVDDLTAEQIAEAVELARNPPRSKDGKTVEEVDTDGWPALQVELYEDIQRGIESYRDPKVTWTARTIETAIPENLNEVGDISVPDGDVPAVAASRNWLFTGMTSRERGDVFEIDKTWELSGRGGWLERYYGE